jgi:hypothetical protein
LSINKTRRVHDCDPSYGERPEVIGHSWSRAKIRDPTQKNKPRLKKELGAWLNSRDTEFKP